jgi:SAM-dependent methyltransferase
MPPTKKKIVDEAPPGFDKYSYYMRAVQAPDTDALFFRDTYKEIRGRDAQSLREDFCGTFAICCEWAKLNPKFESYGIDLDPEPIAYGTKHYLSKLTAAQQKRVHIKEANVLHAGLPKADIICAMNFSHYIFKDRKTLTAYFKNCHASLKSGGIFMADCFGGSRCQEANEDETVHKEFSYYWDQTGFDPISGEALFHIHFKPKGQRKILNVFTYDWRMWTIPELREIMMDAGFKKTTVYWEGTTKSGEGDGEFKPALKGEECEAWIAYIAGEK